MLAQSKNVCASCANQNCLRIMKMFAHPENVCANQKCSRIMRMFAHPENVCANQKCSRIIKMSMHHKPACGRGGGGGVPIPTRGQTLWYSRYICTCVPRSKQSACFRTYKLGYRLTMIPPSPVKFRREVSLHPPPPAPKH